MKDLWNETSEMERYRYLKFSLFEAVGFCETWCLCSWVELPVDLRQRLNDWTAM